MSDTRITFIGAGNMAQALVGGLLARGHAADTVTLTDIDPHRLQQLSATLGVHTQQDNVTAVADADIVVLAVKPQVLQGVCNALSTALARQTLVISIAAGITTSQLTQWLHHDKVVRVMPNTPALVQTGAAGLFATASVTGEEKHLATTILEAAGIALWFTEESKLDAVTAVSGSGPAYFFLLMEAMMGAAATLGLTEDSARQLVLQTALGAATLASQSDDDPATLRRKVTSPGGTTAAALAVFEHAGFTQTVVEALGAAKQRSIELSAG